MQDRYVGDIGDFAKLGLLRALVNGERLGVAWYRYADESHNTDGSHVSFLEHPEKWRHLDPVLFDALARNVRSERRSIRALEASKLLAGATYSGERLSCSETPIIRDAFRRSWFAAVTRDLAGCDIVFADPDNGLVATESFKYATVLGWKRIPVAEAQHLALGRTAVVYHHNSRFKGGHQAEIQHWLRILGSNTAALYWRPFSARTFFVLNPTQAHQDRLLAFAKHWQPHFSIHFAKELTPMKRKGMTTNTKSCPECGHVFQGKGWDGIDAHWKAKHLDIAPYKEAWQIIKNGLKPSAQIPIDPSRGPPARLNPSHDSPEPIDSHQGADLFYKIVEMLQQNWAYIDASTPAEGVRLVFVDDVGQVLDELLYPSVAEAKEDLKSNEFRSYWDDENAREFISPPSAPFVRNPARFRPLYSSGVYWKRYAQRQLLPKHRA